MGFYSGLTLYQDQDGDGNGAPATEIFRCTLLEGYTTVGGDCADLDPNLNVLDIDGDGYTSCSNDCDDEDFLIHPYATERSFDNIDQDCDGYDLGVSTFAGGHHT